MKLAIRWRAVRMFYGSVAPALLGISVLTIGLMQLPLLFEKDGASLASLLIVKLLTAPAVWYLSEQLRPHQYWLYFNLGLSRWQLWGSVVALDALLFAVVVSVINACFAAR